MAFVTQTQTSPLSNFWVGIARFFSAVGRAMIVSSSSYERLRKVEALNAKTDEELAALNLRREDISAYVFRDLMHL